MQTSRAFDAVTRITLSIVFIICSIVAATASAMAVLSNDHKFWEPIECPQSCNCTIDDDGGAWLACDNATGVNQLAYPSQLLSSPGSGDSDTQQSGSFDLNDLDLKVNGKAEHHFRLTMTLSVKSLSVTHNSIEHLANDTLAYLPSLRHLDLSHNVLTSIESGAFSHQSASLSSLLLHHNPLRTLAAAVFWHLANLRVLDLSHCSLHRLDDSVFRDLVALEHLNLSANSFCHVTAVLFTPLTSLSTLNLARNPIVSVESAAFSHLHQLTALNLSQTGLQTLPDSLFDSLERLEILDLSHNAIVSIRLPAWRRNNSLLLALGDSGTLGDSKMATADVIVTNSTQRSPIGRQPTSENDNCSHVHAAQITSSDDEKLNSSGKKDTKASSDGGDAGQLKPEVLASRQRLQFGNGDNNEDTLTIEDLGYDSRLPYDPQMGWMTAAVLGVVLLGFIVAIIVDKVRHRLRARKDMRLQLRLEGAEQQHVHQPSSSSHLHPIEGLDDEDGVSDDYGDFDDVTGSAYRVLDAVTVMPSSQQQTSTLTYSADSAEDNASEFNDEVENDVKPREGQRCLIVVEGGRRYRVVEVHPRCPLHGHPTLSSMRKILQTTAAASQSLHTVVEVYPTPPTHGDVIMGDNDDVIQANF